MILTGVEIRHITPIRAFLLGAQSPRDDMSSISDMDENLKELSEVDIPTAQNTQEEQNEAIPFPRKNSRYA